MRKGDAHLPPTFSDGEKYLREKFSERRYVTLELWSVPLAFHDGRWLGAKCKKLNTLGADLVWWRKSSCEEDYVPPDHFLISSYFKDKLFIHEHGWYYCNREDAVIFTGWHERFYKSGRFFARPLDKYAKNYKSEEIKRCQEQLKRLQKAIRNNEPQVLLSLQEELKPAVISPTLCPR